jgi:sugar/nucleoside kinase (ribokinase family)
MGKGIAIGGNIFVDYIKSIETFPRKGMLANILEERMSIGGCVSNTIIDLARMDGNLPLKALSCLGEDERSKFVLDLFKKNGINCEGIKIRSTISTGYTDVIAARSDNTRTFFNYRGSNSLFDIGDINFASLDVSILHMGYALLLDKFDGEDPQYGTVMARTLATAREYGIKTSLDVVSEDSDRFSRIVIPSLKYCDYLVINEVEGSLIAGIPVRDNGGKLSEQAVHDTCQKLKELGVTESVVLHCPEGGYLLDKSGYYTMPSVNVPPDFIKGTVGAGDAFAAGALYAFYQGWDPEKVLFLANCSAAANLSSADSVSGSRPLEELLALGGKYSGCCSEN